MRFNGKQGLTPTQLQERVRRRKQRKKMHGRPTPPGTKPRVFKVVGEPVFKPIHRFPAKEEILMDIARSKKAKEQPQTKAEEVDLEVQDERR